MSAFSEYQEAGGLTGAAQALLHKQLEQAAQDPDHLLAQVAHALSIGNREKAAEYLILELSRLPDGHPLELLKMALHTLPLIHFAYLDAIEMVEQCEFDEAMPSEIVAWAGMAVAERQKNCHAAKHARSGKPGRREMIEAMRRARGGGNKQTQKEFLRAVEAGSVDDLRLETPNTYVFCPPGFDEVRFTAKQSALSKCWEEAGGSSKTKKRS